MGVIRRMGGKRHGGRREEGGKEGATGMERGQEGGRE